MELGYKIESRFFNRYLGWEGCRQFKGTGKRWEKWLEEMCWENSKIELELEKCLKDFKDGYDEMLVSANNKVWTLCPHHLLPCLFTVNIGYIPNGRVLGLSKFTRIATVFGKRPVMQEQYSRELAEFLMAKLQPKGIGVQVIGSHGCMSTRGVKQDVDVITSVLKGCFMDEQIVRQEFYENVRRYSGNIR